MVDQQFIAVQPNMLWLARGKLYREAEMERYERFKILDALGSRPSRKVGGRPRSMQALARLDVCPRRTGRMGDP